MFFVDFFSYAGGFSVIVENATNDLVTLSDFVLTNSSISRHSSLKKINPKEEIDFFIFPIAGEKDDSFCLKIKTHDAKVKIWWNFIPKKGYGPFLEAISQDVPYRVLKNVNKRGDVIRFKIVEKNEWERDSVARDKAKKMKMELCNYRDIYEQTGFSEAEQRNL
jgi:hypothetical protein